MQENTKVVVDDTTIYEIDLNCYHCLSEQERRKYFPYTQRECNRNGCYNDTRLRRD